MMAWWIEALEWSFVNGDIIGIVVVVRVGVTICLGRDITRGEDKVFVSFADEDLVQKNFYLVL